MAEPDADSAVGANNANDLTARLELRLREMQRKYNQTKTFWGDGDGAGAGAGRVRPQGKLRSGDRGVASPELPARLRARGEQRQTAPKAQEDVPAADSQGDQDWIDVSPGGRDELPPRTPDTVLDAAGPGTKESRMPSMPQAGRGLAGKSPLRRGEQAAEASPEAGAARRGEGWNGRSRRTAAAEEVPSQTLSQTYSSPPEPRRGEVSSPEATLNRLRKGDTTAGKRGLDRATRVGAEARASPSEAEAFDVPDATPAPITFAGSSRPVKESLPARQRAPVAERLPIRERAPGGERERDRTRLPKVTQDLYVSGKYKVVRPIEVKSAPRKGGKKQKDLEVGAIIQVEETTEVQEDCCIMGRLAKGGWVSLVNTSSGYMDAVPEDFHAPGKFRVQEVTPVESVRSGGEFVRDLEKNDLVTVKEVENVLEDNLIRGRLDEGGWITLVQTKTGRIRAKPHERQEQSKRASAGGGFCSFLNMLLVRCFKIIAVAATLVLVLAFLYYSGEIGALLRHSLHSLSPSVTSPPATAAPAPSAPAAPAPRAAPVPRAVPSTHKKNPSVEQAELREAEASAALSFMRIGVQEQADQARAQKILERAVKDANEGRSIEAAKQVKEAERLQMDAHKRFQEKRRATESWLRMRQAAIRKVADEDAQANPSDAVSHVFLAYRPELGAVWLVVLAAASLVALIGAVWARRPPGPALSAAAREPLLAVI